MMTPGSLAVNGGKPCQERQNLEKQVVKDFQNVGMDIGKDIEKCTVCTYVHVYHSHTYILHTNLKNFTPLLIHPKKTTNYIIPFRMMFFSEKKL